MSTTGIPKTEGTREFMTGSNKTYQSYEPLTPEGEAAKEIEALYTRSLAESDFMPSLKDISNIIMKYMRGEK